MFVRNLEGQELQYDGQYIETLKDMERDMLGIATVKINPLTVEALETELKRLSELNSRKTLKHSPCGVETTEPTLLKNRRAVLALQQTIEETQRFNRQQEVGRARLAAWAEDFGSEGLKLSVANNLDWVANAQDEWIKWILYPRTVQTDLVTKPVRTASLSLLKCFEEVKMQFSWIVWKLVRHEMCYYAEGEIASYDGDTFYVQVSLL